MVIKTKSVSKTSRAAPHSPDVIVVRSSTTRHKRDARSRREAEESEAGDVIDLGAPRLLRRAAPDRLKGGRSQRSRPPYTPNPRLYPGARPKPKPRPKRAEARGADGRGRRRKRVFRRPVPNARLYRPAPARPPPPPAWPRATWPPPAPTARLDTASRAALRLSEQRRGRALPRSPVRVPRPPPPPPPAPPELSRRLVVTLPAAPSEPLRYRPASEHFRLRSLDTDSGASTPAAGRAGASAPPPGAAPAMDAGNRHSTSPEDCSDGNETMSAPSEFLAEFLSAIMRRQYAEALKYCRLILQYEPHNATARGFYPLLQHKVQAHKRTEGGEWPRGSSSEEASAHSDKPQPAPPHTHEMMEQGADESDASGSGGGGASRSRSSSCASQSSLELDSSDALAHSSPSLSISRHTDHTDSASGCCWESTGSASRSEPDDNGNAPPTAGFVSGAGAPGVPGAPGAPRAAGAAGAAGDVENDNAAAATHKTDSSSSLRRLRAQFTCSIK